MILDAFTPMGHVKEIRLARERGSKVSPPASRALALSYQTEHQVHTHRTLTLTRALALTRAPTLCARSRAASLLSSSTRWPSAAT